MPKMKTNAAAKKRFTFTGTGKIKRKHAYHSHILTKKTTKQKRNLCYSGTVSAADEGQNQEPAREVNPRRSRPCPQGRGRRTIECGARRASAGKGPATVAGERPRKKRNRPDPKPERISPEERGRTASLTALQKLLRYATFSQCSRFARTQKESFETCQG